MIFHKHWLRKSAYIALSALMLMSVSAGASNVNVHARRTRWHRVMPRYLRGTWRAPRHYHHTHDYVRFTRHSIQSWLPNYEPTVDGSGFTHLRYHYSHGEYFIVGREIGNAPKGGIYSEIRVLRHGRHISYHEHTKGSRWSHWAYMH